MPEIDVDFFRDYQGDRPANLRQVQYVEPKAQAIPETETEALPLAETSTLETIELSDPPPQSIIESKIVTLGDFIDTDALAPGPTLTTCKTDEEFGQHVLEYTHPDFRGKVNSTRDFQVHGDISVD